MFMGAFSFTKYYWRLFLKTWNILILRCVILLNVPKITEAYQVVQDQDSTCLPTSYRRLEIYDQLLNGYIYSTTSTSLDHCSNLCAGQVNCNSFGFNMNDTSCYFYPDRVKISLSSTPLDGMVYYWPLRDLCPNSYELIPTLKICFKPCRYLIDHKTVPEAEAKCNEDGGHLLILDTEEKRKLLSDYFNTTGIKESVVGGLKLGTTEWFWYNGANITNWIENQPDNYGGNENCLQAKLNTITNEIEYNDVPCTQYRYFYICEVPIQ